jgi:hypothetical protein
VSDCGGESWALGVRLWWVKSDCGSQTVVGKVRLWESDCGEKSDCGGKNRLWWESQTVESDFESQTVVGKVRLWGVCFFGNSNDNNTDCDRK